MGYGKMAKVMVKKTGGRGIFLLGPFMEAKNAVPAFIGNGFVIINFFSKNCVQNLR